MTAVDQEQTEAIRQLVPFAAALGVGPKAVLIVGDEGDARLARRSGTRGHENGQEKDNKPAGKTVSHG